MKRQSVVSVSATPVAIPAHGSIGSPPVGIGHARSLQGGMAAPRNAPEWPIVRLGDHAETCLGKMLDQHKNKGEYHPYLGNSDVRWGRFDLSNLSKMRFEDHEHDRYGLKYGDLVVCEGGEPGRAAIWRSEIPNMKIQKALHRIRAGSKFDNAFLYYWFLHAGSTGTMEPYFTGTTIKHLPGQALANLQVVQPPLPIQKAIAHILGTLDDRIELCRRMNETLEAMARAQFKDWFIDFGPVRAKMEGREPPGLSPEIAALFPSKLVDSELGEIPEGWNFSKLKNLTSHLSRGIGPSYIEDAGVCVLNQKCIRDHRVNFALARRHDPLKRSISGRTVKVHDLLVNSTGVGTLGRVAPILYLNEEMIVDSHVTIVRADENTDAIFLNMTLIVREQEIEALGEGSTGQTELSRLQLGEMTLLQPPLDVQLAYGKSVSSAFDQIGKNEQRVTTLSTLRDTLLPKLLSGELSIPEAMLQVEAA